MTGEEAGAYLESLTNFERLRDPNAMQSIRVERMRRLCRSLGDPQRRFRSILVAGTNGKGSVCALLYAMLRESPLRVGLYTSPHLEQARERIRVASGGSGGGALSEGEDWIREEDFAALTAELQPILEAMGHTPEGVPTYFEALTAIALSHFNRRGVDIAVLEVGLGGRLDATNVVDQAISIFTPIDVDHAEILGSDPETIAREKAGIIKPGQFVLTAPQPEGVRRLLRQACEASGVPLLACGEDLTVQVHDHDLDGLQISVTGLRGIYESLRLPWRGRHQAQNAALAVGALELLSGSGVPHSLVEHGLARAVWPGRLDVAHDEPLVLLDGAHNAHAAKALADALRELVPGRPLHLLLGVSADKSVEAIGQQLGGLAVSATCTKSAHPRALDPTALAARFFPFCHDVHVMPDPVDAYTYLLNAASSRDVIVVTGSLFLVGELRSAIRHALARSPRQLQTA